MKRAALAVSLMDGAGFATPADQPGHHSWAPGTNTKSVSATEDAVAGIVGTVSAEITSTTKGFVTVAVTSDMYEVTAAKPAIERGGRAAVKDFARKMIDAHTKTTEKLKAIIASNKLMVNAPAHVDDRC